MAMVSRAVDRFRRYGAKCFTPLSITEKKDADVDERLSQGVGASSSTVASTPVRVVRRQIL